MKAIVTRQNADGTYDCVGMNNRTVVGPYKTRWGLRRYGVEYHLEKWAMQGPRKQVRIELFYGDNLQKETPDRVDFVQF